MTYLGTSGGGMTGPPQAGIGTQASTGGGWSSMNTYSTASAVSGIISAFSQISAARHQEEVAEHNIEMAKMEARYQELRSEYQKNALRRKAMTLRGKQRAAYSAAGVSPDVGTPAKVGKETLEDVEEDAAMIEMAGKAASMQAEGRAAQAEYVADIAQPAGYARAGTSLLGTAERLRRVK